MAKRILAPIDAREHSERVIPIVAAMAREMGSTVRLLRVFPVPERVVDEYGRTVAYVDQEMERLTARGLTICIRPKPPWKVCRWRRSCALARRLTRSCWRPRPSAPTSSP